VFVKTNTDTVNTSINTVECTLQNFFTAIRFAIRRLYSMDHSEEPKNVYPLVISALTNSWLGFDAKSSYTAVYKEHIGGLMCPSLIGILMNSIHWKHEAVTAYIHKLQQEARCIKNLLVKDWSAFKLTEWLRELFSTTALIATTMGERIQEEIMTYLDVSQTSVVWDLRERARVFLEDLDSNRTQWDISGQEVPTYYILEMVAIVMKYSNATITTRWAQEPFGSWCADSTDYFRNLSVSDEIHVASSLMDSLRDTPFIDPLGKSKLMGAVFMRVVDSRQDMMVRVVGNLVSQQYNFRQQLWKRCNFLTFLCTSRKGKDLKVGKTKTEALTTTSDPMLDAKLKLLQKGGLLS
jgi:hypothetical protein